MAKNLRKKADIAIRPEMIITGKWNRNAYIVKRKIGAGMIGTVYLCETKNRLAALKISEQATSLIAEVNVLKSLNKVQDDRLGPFLLDVDDWETENGNVYSFYVMTYIKGTSMEKYVKRNGYEWIGVFLVQMLDQLEKLHESGWVFGDLKNDNILISDAPPMVQFIDVGGTTKIGRSIKEYSEFYDRAYWHLGTREAEPSYDLFAVVMVILAIFYPDKFKRTADSRRLIIHKLRAIPELKLYNRSLQNAVLGKYETASQMKDELMQQVASRPMAAREEGKSKSAYRREAAAIAVIAGMYYMMSQILF